MLTRLMCTQTHGGFQSVRYNPGYSALKLSPCVLRTGVTIPQVLGSVLGPSLQKRHGGPRMCPEKGSGAERDLEHESDGEQLRELGLFTGVLQ